MLNATIAAAVRAGVSLTLEDGRLRYRAPAGALTPALRASLTAHRDELRRLLSLPGEAPEYAAALADCAKALGGQRVERRPKPCYLCGGTRRRTRPGGDTLCAICHPEEARPSFSIDHLSA